ncbi:hypothetical protein [Streptomyces sp. NBC_00271]|nr:hypothetical protein [Streptomyces sp. NBC_00271]
MAVAKMLADGSEAIADFLNQLLCDRAHLARADDSVRRLTG